MILTSRTPCFAFGIAAVLPQKDAGGAPEPVVARVAALASVAVVAAVVAAVAAGLLQRCPAAPVQVWMSSRTAGLPFGSVRHRPDLGLTTSPSDSRVQTWAAVPLQGYQSTLVPLVVPAP